MTDRLRFTGRTSAVLLILSNLIPLIGVLFFGWSLFALMLLFWIENLVIGFYALLRIFYAGLGPRGLKVFVVPFFVVHFGMFSLAHAILVLALFNPGGYRAFEAGLETGTIISSLPPFSHLALPAAALLFSHGYSFVTNYLRGGEFSTTIPIAAMFQPYGRVAVLHATVIAGAVLARVTGGHWIALSILVLLKTTMDLRAHLREHSRGANVDAGLEKR